MNFYISKHKKATQEKLRKMKNKNPKDYWKILNSLDNKPENADIKLDDLYSFFNLNSCHFRRGFDTKVLFSDHFCAFWGGQNKRISVGFFSFYSIARKTVGLNPTHFHINFFLSC